MAGIFTRKAIAAILNDEALTPEERTDQLFSLYGRALDDGYVTKSAAQAATAAAVDAAKEQFTKDLKTPDAKESAEYKALQEEYAAFKARQDARFTADFAGVKPKFFDAVYDKIDRADGAKPISDQLAAIKEAFEEYFTLTPDDQGKKAAPAAPQFGAKSEGQMPTGDGGNSFAKFWGYEKQKG